MRQGGKSTTFWSQIWGCSDPLRGHADYGKRCSSGQRIFWRGNFKIKQNFFEISENPSAKKLFRGPVTPKRCPLARKCPVRTFSVSTRGIVWQWSGVEKSRNKIFFPEIFDFLICPHLGALAPTAPRPSPDLRPMGVRVRLKRRPSKFHRAGDISILTKTSYPPRSIC